VRFHRETARARVPANCTPAAQLSGWKPSSRNSPPRRVENLGKLKTTFEEVASELRSAYVLNYYTGVPFDGTWHDLSLAALDSHYTVHARRGFFAQTEQSSQASQWTRPETRLPPDIARKLADAGTAAPRELAKADVAPSFANKRKKPEDE
jgi:hypothetical protein